MFKKVLVANRGEIACRILRTLRRMGIASVAVHSEADAHALHVRDADEAILLGPASGAAIYLDGAQILAGAARLGVDAIHPGYGFLSENADFAAACQAAGIRFIGPTPDQIRSFGLKHLAREIAQRQGVPLLPGTGILRDGDDARREAARLGYPVMLKSTAGGGGIGLRVCYDDASLAANFESVERLSKHNFGEGGAFLEKFVAAARHVEVQIFGDGEGRVLALGERDCSLQRRNQKVVEETPAPRLSDVTRRRLHEEAVSMGSAVRYASAGTVEFIVDARTQEIYFLEVNTRLQVEHGITEEVTGIDLVEWMIRQAAGEHFLPAEAPKAQGAAIEVRIYAEDPGKNHQPSTGVLTDVRFPSNARVETWIEPGTEITPHYDPLLAKLIVRAGDRAAAVAALGEALRESHLAGLETNLRYLREIAVAPAFVEGEVTTSLLSKIAYAPRAIDVLDGGMQTSVQDYPGRVGMWSVGVPPSGPMDDLAFRLANRLVGNPLGAPALEMTLSGPTLRFRVGARIAITGAPMKGTIDGAPIPYNRAFDVPAGAMLKLGVVAGRGCRTYLAVHGGLDVPEIFGSRSTFMLGRFGGHGGRALRAGDVLHLGDATLSIDDSAPSDLPPSLVPSYPETWEIGVLYGPHGAPDFFTEADIEAIFDATWQVHYNSDRTGVRLVGPKPTWARRDGGEAGLHPSNIHDTAYAIGTIDYTGDMPVVLGPDGPSLGGFVCPATIVRAERWKMGQLVAGDRVRFRRLGADEAARLERAQEREILNLENDQPGRAGLAPEPRVSASASKEAPILDELAATHERVRVVYRRAGDEYLLVEYGPLTLDIALRLRVHVLMQALEREHVRGILDLTPGIRSLQVHYDPSKIATAALVDVLRSIERDLPRIDEIEVPTRIVHLPLSWEDPATLLAIEKYTRSVRKDAPWCPSNIEFIRRINGLSSVRDVERIVFDASYLVLGLGDVYLGAPVATPIDPRHRLVTTKYNPARTWTPENAVGIGGAYLCIYGMEGPGGYQFVGRTLQVWNTYRQTGAFRDDKPYLLRFFDEIRFYPVGADELLRMRAAFPTGTVPLRIEESSFSYRRYRAFLEENAGSIAEFKWTQQAAFEAERERWRAAGQDIVSPALPETSNPVAEAALPAGCTPVTSPVAGSLWKVLATPGQAVTEGEPLLIVEAMKMEITVASPESGTLRDVLVQPGAPVLPGQPVAIVEASPS